MVVQMVILYHIKTFAFNTIYNKNMILKYCSKSTEREFHNIFAVRFMERRIMIVRAHDFTTDEVVI